jgi:hypothetical protein
MYEKSYPQVMISIPISIEISVIVCWLTNTLTSCTATRCKLYFVKSLTTVFNEPALVRLLTFHVPNLTTVFRCVGRNKESAIPSLRVTFRNKLFSYGELLSPLPTAKLEDHPLSVERDCLLNIFAATLHTSRPSSSPATRGRAMPW